MLAELALRLMSLKIYISSTFDDLDEYRERVYRQLRRLRHDVIAMEDYVATDQRPLEKCLRDVRESDVYVGLFAWRYGYVPPKNNPGELSITELELLQAVAHDKPCLIFLVKDKVPWPPMFMDVTTGAGEKGARITALRNRLQEERVVGLFETADELAAIVVSALYQWETEASVLAAGSGTEPSPLSDDRRPATPRSATPLLWDPGSTLRVRFLGGDEILNRRTIRLARIWEAYANINFVESSDEDAEVRLDYQPGDGSWAYEGTKSLDVDASQRTMNLGWVHPDSPVGEIELAVLHEFGHVLGLGHEHNNPHGEIPWNKEAVYQSMMAPPNNWTRAGVDRNMFSQWDADRFPFKKPFDPLSIMAYTFPAEFTGGEELFGRNLAISAGDKEFVSRLYPYPAS